MKKLTVKRKNSPKADIFRPPGEFLQKHIQTGEPKFMGKYIVFYTVENDAWDCMPMAIPDLIDYDGEKWSVKRHVIGWIGPLPNLSIDELQDFAPNEAPVTLFFISTPKLAKKEIYTDGPYYRLLAAKCTKGSKGQCIYEVNFRKTKHKLLCKWRESSQKWVQVKERIMKNES